jgi:hypothetical protein
MPFMIVKLLSYGSKTQTQTLIWTTHFT